MQQVRLELDSNVRRVSNGTALLGGSPFRVMRLSDAGLSVEIVAICSSLVMYNKRSITLAWTIVKRLTNLIFVCISMFQAANNSIDCELS